jgi:hypothetical protein
MSTTDGNETVEAFKCYMTERKEVGKHYDVYFKEDIYNFWNYIDLMQVFNNATTDDTINLYLVGYGGQADACKCLLEAMELSNAYITIHVRGPVASAHAMLAMGGDRLVTAPGAVFMFHETTYDIENKTINLPDFTAHTDFKDREHYDYWCSDFLTKDEIKRALAGQQVYISSLTTNFTWRIKEHNEARRALRYTVKFQKEQQ